MSNTTGRSQAAKDYRATVGSPSNPVYFNTTATTETYRNNHNHTNTSPHAAEYATTTVTPPSNSTATASAFTAEVDGSPHRDTATTGSTNTPSDTVMTQHNLTDSLKTYNHTFTPNSAPGASNVTPDPNCTGVNSVATAANADTTVSKHDTAEFDNAAGGTGGATTAGFMPSLDYTNVNNGATVSAPSTTTTTASPHPTSAFRETPQVALDTTASDVYTLSNAAAVTQSSAQSTAGASRPAAAASSAASISQTTSNDPAGASSAATGNAGLSATDPSNPRGPQSAEISITLTTPPLASATATMSRPTTPGMYGSKLFNLRMLRNRKGKKKKP